MVQLKTFAILKIAFEAFGNRARSHLSQETFSKADVFADAIHNHVSSFNSRRTKDESSHKSMTQTLSAAIFHLSLVRIMQTFIAH